jgi:hypothetical protein
MICWRIASGVRMGQLSQNTGGYARACGRIGVGVVEKACDQLPGELSNLPMKHSGLEFFALQ